MGTMIDTVLLTIMVLQTALAVWQEGDQHIKESWSMKKAIAFRLTAFAAASIILLMVLGLISYLEPEGFLWTSWLMLNVVTTAVLLSEPMKERFWEWKYKTHFTTLSCIWVVAAIIT